MEEGSVTSADLNQMMTVAQLQYSSGRYREALHICERIYSLDAYRPENLLLLGGVHFQLRNFSEAIFYNQQAIRVDPHLAEAYGNSSASPRDKKRDPPRDVSTAHVDVVNYPSVVLTLPWYEIVTKTPGDLVLADLPRSLVGADLDAGRPRGLGRSSISPLDGPPEKRPVAAEFGNMGRERSNSVRSIGSPRNSLGGGSPSPSASAAKKGVASPPKTQWKMAWSVPGKRLAAQTDLCKCPRALSRTAMEAAER